MNVAITAIAEVGCKQEATVDQKVERRVLFIDIKVH